MTLTIVALTLRVLIIDEIMTLPTINTKYLIIRANINMTIQLCNQNINISSFICIKFQDEGNVGKDFLN